MPDDIRKIKNSSKSKYKNIPATFVNLVTRLYIRVDFANDEEQFSFKRFILWLT